MNWLVTSVRTISLSTEGNQNCLAMCVIGTILLAANGDSPLAPGVESSNCEAGGSWSGLLPSRSSEGDKHEAVGNHHISTVFLECKNDRSSLTFEPALPPPMGRLHRAAAPWTMPQLGRSAGLRVPVGEVSSATGQGEHRQHQCKLPTPAGRA